MIYFVKRQDSVLRLQIFVEDLIAADVEIPHGLRHRLEELGLVDRDRRPVEVHVRIQYPWPSGTAEKKKATNGMADG